MARLLNLDFLYLFGNLYTVIISVHLFECSLTVAVVGGGSQVEFGPTCSGIVSANRKPEIIFYFQFHVF